MSLVLVSTERCPFTQAAREPGRIWQCAKPAGHPVRITKKDPRREVGHVMRRELARLKVVHAEVSES